MIDSSNEPNRCAERSSGCSSSEHRHSSVELHKVLPVRFDSADKVHHCSADAAAEDCVGGIDDVADIEEYKDRICVKGSISVEIASINSSIHSFSLTWSNFAEPEPDN